MERVTTGDIVHLHYTGKFEDGTVFDSTEGGDPLELVAGATDIIDGVSQGIIGLEVGEKRTLTVPPERGYGTRDESLQKKVPLDALPEGIEVGDRVSANAGGHEIVFLVTSIDGADAMIDANHPLAGRTLVFDLAVHSIHGNDPGRLQRSHGHDHGECGCGHDH
ncbi:MAG TPA: peptidylprolyl isomerase [Planctomycetota bacterium]|nr:peptidylprolyl isomerase [Planctomycetota bacterium]